MRMTTGRGEERETETGSALVVDPAAYARAHPGTGSLDALRGAAVAVGPGGEVSAGERVSIELAGHDLGELPVVSEVPESMSGGPNVLLPAGLVPAELLAGSPARTFVTLAPGADEAAVRAALGATGTVRDVSDWLADDAAARNAIGNDIMLVVLGLGALYALIGVVNSVVIGAAARRREFAAARATGLTRGQVVRAALLESVAVTVSGVVLGALAAGTAFIAVLTVTAAVTGRATLDLPWTIMFAVAGAALVATVVTSVLTSWSATRTSPVALLGARE
jgi:putative ABC transport system permease protein